MRHHIKEEIDMIRNGLSKSQNINYYPDIAEFIEPHTMKVSDNVTIRAKMIFLCTSSKPFLPPIKGLEDITNHTSDTILAMDRLPKSIAIVGGGYIATEYGRFFSSMESKVTILGRNKQFLHTEETEISALADREIGRHITIITNNEVIEVDEQEAALANNNDNSNKDKRKQRKNLIIKDRNTGERRTITAEVVLIAAGRSPNTDILHPERAMIKTDEKGWIVVNEYLETSLSNIWAFVDAKGVYPFKHKANYEAELVSFHGLNLLTSHVSTLTLYVPNLTGASNVSNIEPHHKNPQPNKN
jgi:mycothione reductase